MPTIYMFRGLPASGKSTKRKEMLAAASLPIVAANKDEIRRAMGIRAGDFSREKEVLVAETQLIEKAFRSGASIILDNTHNSPKYLRKYQDLAKAHDYEFKLIDLSDVPVEECIRRDALRTGNEHVGERKILEMYNQFYNKTGVKKEPSKTAPPVTQTPKKARSEWVRPIPMVQDSKLPKCLIVDLDGTIAIANDRSWFEYHKCGSDILVEAIRDIVKGLLFSSAGIEHIVFLTGRETSGRDAALGWLESAEFDFKKKVAGLPVCQLLMKATGDNRPDTETKRELFENHVRDKFYVVAIFEDRNKVVQMWREMGLLCLQVADGDY